MKPYRTVADVIEDAYDESGAPRRHLSNANGSRQVKGIKPMRTTEEPAYCVQASGPARLVRTDFEPHPDATRTEAGVRRFTEREMARFQSFPDDFEFIADTLTSERRQIGNAVPPRLARHLAEVMR